ncbi:malonic semialdehyde reductase [Bradyrhizobium sp. Ash2021]|uniref:malonic semialdehyde reductase n=1 Tax=Bradyrhizobium sp. Ash2021 TaxID=2954771 RepID=UPI002814A415|nr:malonic semialdehyde reductase [Bradyrhizobium sp. Ash2021]WMT78938.1 malonic semialdehyde reductase [Bradyrhizobium sp. Ash2021]
MSLCQAGLDLLFNSARSHNGWQDKPVTEAQLRQLYDLMKFGPTSLNSSPARIVFALSDSAKQRVVEAVSPGNVEKTRTAPVIAIVGYDLDFAAKLPALFPHKPEATKLFHDKPELIQDTAFRNSSLQGAYSIMASRALGLDCGPMSGFDPQKIKQAFFSGQRVRVNFLCGIGYGDPSKLFPRSPRLAFAEACSVI